MGPSAKGGKPRVGHLAGAAGWPWGEGACMMCMHAASVGGLVEVELLFLESDWNLQLSD